MREGKEIKALHGARVKNHSASAGIGLVAVIQLDMDLNFCEQASSRERHLILRMMAYSEKVSNATLQYACEVSYIC